MVQKDLVDGYRVLSVREGGEPRGFSGSYELLSRPYTVRCCFGEEVHPVGGLGSLDGLEVPESGLLDGGEAGLGLEFSDFV